MKLVALVVLASGCFVLPERHPTDRPGDDAGRDGTGSDGSNNGLPHANIIFVTAGHFTLNAGHTGPMRVDDADAYCYMAAIDAPQSSPVRNHYYLGWLSADPINIRDRLGVKNARAWMRVDGAPIAATLIDLTSGTLLNPPDLDETGQPIVAGERAMTGTTPDGSYDAGSDAGCPQGHLTSGDPRAMDATWTRASGYTLCDDVASHLYCVGYDIQDGQL